MADRFELDESEAHAAGDRAESAGERLLAARRDLVAVLDDREGCWGTDEIGKAFSKNYVEMADGTRVNTENLGTNLSEVGKTISVMANDFAEVDEDNANKIDELYADQVEDWTEAP